jgi:hypothetical protein
MMGPECERIQIPPRSSARAESRPRTQGPRSGLEDKRNRTFGALLGPGAPLTVRCWCRARTMVRGSRLESCPTVVSHRCRDRRAGPTRPFAGRHLRVGHSPVGRLLAGAGEPLYERAADPPAVNGGGSSYLLSQTQQTARRWAGDDPLRSDHLLVAVIDQANPEALAALARAGLEAGAVRSAALGLIGVSTDLPRLAIPPLPPAGTVDRPPLPVEELDPRAWQVLTWRQEHLPLERARRTDDWHALSSLERRAAWPVADRLRLDDDQRYSLYAQHHEA